MVAQDGTISFLEVNTRLQVEHPVSEEVTGLDLVREQFRLAEGGVLDYADPEIKGHSFEFRINGQHQDPQTIAQQSEAAAPVSASARAAFDRLASAMRVQLSSAELIQQASAQ